MKVIFLIALLYIAIFFHPVLPASSTGTMASDTEAALDNVTSLNQTLTNLANQTLTSLNETVSEQARLAEEARVRIDQTLTSLNETVSEQARLAEETRVGIRENATAATEDVRQEFQGAFSDLPVSISYMLGIAFVLVIAVPVIIDLVYPNRKGRGHRADLYRALMTFGVIIVVGIVVVYLIALINFNISATNNDNVQALIDVLKNLSTILGTALAAIVAFYFGAKTAQGGEGSRGPSESPRGGIDGGQNAAATAGGRRDGGGDDITRSTTNSNTR